MPSAEERKVMHLANIGNYLHDLVKVMEAVNKNLVELAKIVQKEEPQITHVDLAKNYVARLPNEFDEHFKKEGE